MNHNPNIFKLQQELKFFSEATLHSYAALLFSQSRWTGMLMIIATLVQPTLALIGVTAAFGSAVLARLLRFSEDSIQAGLYGYNAILTSMAIMMLTSHGLLGHQGILIALAGGLATVPLTAALISITQRTWSLPVLALPFLLIFAVMYGLTDHSPLDQARVAASDLSFGATLALVFKTFGSILFLPRIEVGILVLVALFLHSRMATTAAITGIFVGILMRDLALGHDISGVYYAPLPLNGMLSALAVAAIFFVPGRMTWLWGLGASAMACMLTITLHAWWGDAMPPLIIPFVLSTWIVLLMARQRVRDDAPRSTYFITRSPESNYRFHHTGGGNSTHGEPEITLPFRGNWICTQGINGEHTHQGPWRYAFDFEVTNPDGQLFANNGDFPEDFYCYDLPVVAVADGTVCRIIDHIPDNPIGEANLTDNWGNTVILYHQAGLYSAVSHLKAGSIDVAIGQQVSRGQQLGLCGNSGRSPRPHLHFQMQSTDELGAETILRPFARCLKNEDTPRFESKHIPALGEQLSATAFSRNIEALLPKPLFTPDTQWAVRLNNDKQFQTTLSHGVDIEGRTYMSTDGRKAKLFTSSDYARFACHERIGKHSDLLRLHALALPQLPKIDTPGYAWEQQVPLLELLPQFFWPALELFIPWLGLDGLRMTYRVQHLQGRLQVHGESQLKCFGRPLLSTQAQLSNDAGIHFLHAQILEHSIQAALISHTHLLHSEGAVPCTATLEM